MKYLSDPAGSRILSEGSMRAGAFIAALTVACLSLVVSIAQATPTQVNVRIEGKSETLFEGPIWTEGHDVKASSDSQARPCDGTNDHQHATPGAAPTASAVDAMRIIGETFDAQWYGSSFDDYFLTRFGPDEKSTTEGAYWGILVNDVFTSVGGCQYELGPDNEVLWVYDAFKERPLLALLPVAAHYTSGRRPLTATAELGKPFQVEVVNYANDKEDTPPSTPERTGSTPEPGARVSPVDTAANGFEKIATDSFPTVLTDAQGKASVTFTKPGWHRIKATVLTPQGTEVAVRSNRLDVCVPPEGQSACEEPPAEDQVRTPPPPEEKAIEEAPELPIEPIHITPKNSTDKGRLESTVRFLQNAQNRDGGFGGEVGGESSQDFSAWVTFALAADSINPQDQATDGGVDAYTYLTTHAAQALREELCRPSICTTSLERELLVADAAGTSPHDYGSIDLVSELLARKLPDGSFPFVPGGRGEINDTIYAILSLSLVQEPAAQSAVKAATEWLIAAQNPDGSWSPQSSKTEAGEVDMTGAALQALDAPGQPSPGESQQKALKYLHEAQEPDGGFPERPGEGESNVASTAWAVQGLWAAGENPENWVKGSGREPLGYMESLQQPDGHIRYRAREELNGVWMTAYVAPAFAGQPLPIPAVPRSTKGTPTPPSPEKPTPSPGSAEHGQGGVSSLPAGGVIAGGGGAGASLFSRPQPQSRGEKPGGRRQLRSTHASAAHKDKQRRNPGIRRKTADRTTATQGPGSASTGTGSGGSAGTRALLSTTDSGAQQPGGQEVNGVLIGAPGSTDAQSALEPGAPGLHGAGAGGNQTPWLAIGIASALLLSALAGTQIEQRRSQVIL
jgi:prenyltransferase beta subunit